MSPEPTNGELIDAQVEAIMSGNRRDIDRYLVRGVMVMQAAVKEMPRQVEEAVSKHATACPLVVKVQSLEAARLQAQGRRGLIAAIPSWVGMVAFLASLVIAILALVVHG